MPGGPLDRLRSRVPWLNRLDSRLLITFLFVAAALGLFLHIASEVMEGETLALDRWLLQSLRDANDPAIPVGPTWLNEAFVEVTALGGTTVLTLLTVFAFFYLVARRRVAMAVFVAAAISAGALLNSGLKALFLRDRPDIVPHLVEVSSASFPSGHAMNSAMVYLTLAALLITAERSLRVRIFLMVAALCLTLLVGISRVYLGVHWPTDVLAGWSVGAAWAVLSALIARHLQRTRYLDDPKDEYPHA